MPGEPPNSRASRDYRGPRSSAPNPLDFSGKCVIVTGGTKGIGRAMATTFMGYGADVVVCAREPTGRTRHRCRQDGGTS